jgi:hypothetical protein
VGAGEGGDAIDGQRAAGRRVGQRPLPLPQPLARALRAALHRFPQARTLRP